MFDFCDLPMRDAVDLKDWEDLPGEKVYQYLKAYAEKFSLIERMRLGTRISHISRNSDGKAWNLEVAGSIEVVICDKLMIAVGLNSKPNWPQVPREHFNGIAIHSQDIGLRHADLTSEKVHRVTVYGGCKSAIDAIILCIEAGKKVDWVIRETGNGPGMFVVPRKGGVHLQRFAGRYKNVLTPSIFSLDTCWYRFLHSGKSRIGNWIFKKVWAKASSAPLTMGPYKTKTKSSNMEKLMPETGR